MTELSSFDYGSRRSDRSETMNVTADIFDSQKAAIDSMHARSIDQWFFDAANDGNADTGQGIVVLGPDNRR